MFTTNSIEFLTELAANNNRDWFTANKNRYQSFVKTPADSFRQALAEQLSLSVKKTIDSKLFRIHRDVRFSKDKTPYNAYIRMAFSEENSGDSAWVISIEPDCLTLGYGIFTFSADHLAIWREVVSGGLGETLSNMLQGGELAKLRSAEPELKRVPSPYPKDHPQASLLRRKGIVLWLDDLPLKEALGDQAPAKISEAMQSFEPLRVWLNEAKMMSPTNE